MNCQVTPFTFYATVWTDSDFPLSYVSCALFYSLTLTPLVPYSHTTIQPDNSPSLFAHSTQILQSVPHTSTQLCLPGINLNMCINNQYYILMQITFYSILITEENIGFSTEIVEIKSDVK